MASYIGRGARRVLVSVSSKTRAKRPPGQRDPLSKVTRAEILFEPTVQCSEEHESEEVARIRRPLDVSSTPRTMSRPTGNGSLMPSRLGAPNQAAPARILVSPSCAEQLASHAFEDDAHDSIGEQVLWQGRA